jgi:DNA-binding NtrC family response regulator
VKLNCGELLDDLLESELFGHEKGAFTGAVSRKPGRVELAHNGTLFLDEVGEMSRTMQVKLLRVLEYREFQRVGGTQKIEVDVRFVAATHRDLRARVASGDFREDLFHRLEVLPIDVPPLRDRHGDVELIAHKLCAAFGRDNKRPSIHFADASLTLLAEQPWPGNVRQLRNLVERLVVLSDSDEIGPADVQREVGRPPLVPDSRGSVRRRRSLRASVLARAEGRRRERSGHERARACQKRPNTRRAPARGEPQHPLQQAPPVRPRLQGLGSP